MKAIQRDFWITTAGLATSLAAAWLVVKLDEVAKFYFYSLMGWGIVPFGAILCGLVGAIGYYLAAKWLDQRPSPSIRWGMVLVSALTYFVIQYLEYVSTTADGIRVSSVMSLFEFWKLGAGNMTMTMTRHGMDSGSGVSLGAFGYVVAVLQILGFTVGGWVAYYMLASHNYCETCGRYFKRIKRIEKTVNNEDEALAIINDSKEAFREAKFTEVYSRFAALEPAKAPMLKKCAWAVALIVEECPTCKERRVEAQLLESTKNGYQEVDSYTVKSVAQSWTLDLH